jgi:YHS domain-containing protein
MTSSDTPTVTDPVCGMTIHPEDAAATEEYGGRTYYFCSEDCHRQFTADPEKYVADSSPATGVYVCPMHPEVHQVGPGTCPKCGMDLMPESGATTTGDASGHAAHDHHADQPHPAGVAGLGLWDVLDGSAGSSTCTRSGSRSRGECAARGSPCGTPKTRSRRKGCRTTPGSPVDAEAEFRPVDNQLIFWYRCNTAQHKTL